MTKCAIIIAGSTKFNDAGFFETAIDNIASQYDSVTIVEGGCDGADRLAREYAAARGYGRKRYDADWKAFGDWAGRIRNTEMVKAHAPTEHSKSYCVGFWRKGSMKSTFDCMVKASGAGYITIVYPCDEEHKPLGYGGLWKGRINPFGNTPYAPLIKALAKTAEKDYGLKTIPDPDEMVLELEPLADLHSYISTNGRAQ